MKNVLKMAFKPIILGVILGFLILSGARTLNDFTLQPVSSDIFTVSHVTHVTASSLEVNGKVYPVKIDRAFLLPSPKREKQLVVETLEGILGWQVCRVYEVRLDFIRKPVSFRIASVDDD